MSPIIRRARPADHAAVLDLLRAASLPIDGLEEDFEFLLVAENGNGILGAAGLEFYDPYALLRSVVVEASARGTGLGATLTRRALAEAHTRGVRGVYLFTTTAEDYFTRFGFERVARTEVPVEVQQSIEFRSACPASATVMRRSGDTA
jgi:amino-acid N-acetyltransferase